METTPFSGNPLVILNPAANRGRIEPYRVLVRRRIADEQAEYVETAKSGDARELALRAATEGRPVIIVGGDGSVHEAVNGILTAGRRVPLGIVPTGSGNDFAWNTLKLPHDPAAALEKALLGRLIDVDAGTVNGEYFANSFSVGLDADIGDAANTLKKFPLMSGARLYYASTLKQLLFGYHRCPWLKLRLDGGEYVRGNDHRRYVLVAVTNGPTYGAGFRINPTADHTDGLFDVCTIDYTPLPRALQNLPIVRKGEHGGLPEATFFRARSVHIECQRPTHMQADGEITSTASYTAEVLPGALLVRV